MILKTIIFILCVKTVLNAPSAPKIDLTKQKEDEIVQKIAIQLLAISEETDEDHDRKDRQDTRHDNKEASIEESTKLNDSTKNNEKNTGVSKDSVKNNQDNEKEASIKESKNRNLKDSKENNKRVSKDSKKDLRDNDRKKSIEESINRNLKDRKEKYAEVSKDSNENRQDNKGVSVKEEANKKYGKDSKIISEGNLHKKSSEFYKEINEDHFNDRSEYDKTNVPKQPSIVSNENNNDHLKKNKKIDQNTGPEKAKSIERNKNNEKIGAVLGSKRKGVYTESSVEAPKSYKLPNGSPRIASGNKNNRNDNNKKVINQRDKVIKGFNDDSSVENAKRFKMPNNMNRNKRNLKRSNNDNEDFIKKQQRDKINEKSFENNKKQGSKKQPNLLPIRVLTDETKLEDTTKKNGLKLKLKSNSNKENTNIMYLKSRRNRQGKEDLIDEVKSSQSSSQDGEAKNSTIKVTVLNEGKIDNVSANIAKSDSKDIRESSTANVEAIEDVKNYTKMLREENEENNSNGTGNKYEEKSVTETSTDKTETTNAVTKTATINKNKNEDEHKNDDQTTAIKTTKTVENSETETTTKEIGNEYPLSEVKEGDSDNILRRNRTESIIDKTFISMTPDDDGLKPIFRLNPEGGSNSDENSKVSTEATGDKKTKEFLKTKEDNEKTENPTSVNESLNFKASKDNLTTQNNDSNVVNPIFQLVNNNSLYEIVSTTEILDHTNKISDQIEKIVTEETTNTPKYLENNMNATLIMKAVDVKDSTEAKNSDKSIEIDNQGNEDTTKAIVNVQTTTDRVKLDFITNKTYLTTKETMKESINIAPENTEVDMTTKQKSTKDLKEVSNSLAEESHANNAEPKIESTKPAISEKATTVYQSRRTAQNAATNDMTLSNKEYGPFVKAVKPILRNTKNNKSKENYGRLDKVNNFRDNKEEKKNDAPNSKKTDNGYKVFEFENSPFEKLSQFEMQNGDSKQFEYEYYHVTNNNGDVKFDKDFEDISHLEENRTVYTKTTQENDANNEHATDHSRKDDSAFVIPNHIHASSESKMMKIRLQGDKFFENKILLPDDSKPLKHTNKKPVKFIVPKHRHRIQKKKQFPISEYLSIAPNYLSKSNGEDNSFPDILKYNKELHIRAMNGQFRNELRTDNEVNIFEKVMKDMVEIDFDGLEQYDWLGSTVDIRAALDKLIHIANAITNQGRIHPSDKELFKYVVYLYIVATNAFRSRDDFDNNYESDNYGSDNYYHDDNIRYIPEYDGHISNEDRNDNIYELSQKYFNTLDTLRYFLLPRNKRKKEGEKIQNPLAMVDAVFRNILRYGDMPIEASVVLDLKEFLLDARDSLNQLHRAIKEIVTNSNYNNLNIYQDLRRGYLRVLNRRKILQLVLHLTLHRTLGLVEESARSGLEINFKRYLQRNEKEVSRTIEELHLVVKLVATNKLI